MTMPSPPFRVAGSDQFVGLADPAFALLPTNQRSGSDIYRTTRSNVSPSPTGSIAISMRGSR